MAATTQHRLSREDVVWEFGPDLEPVLEVEPGTVVTFGTNDCFTGQIRSEADLITEIDFTRVNSATGPIAVSGAEPGDSLVAEILGHPYRGPRLRDVDSGDGPTPRARAPVCARVCNVWIA